MAKGENFWGGSTVFWMIHNTLMENRNIDSPSTPIRNKKVVRNWNSIDTHADLEIGAC